ncbi:hypothetical protein ASE46_19700 [Bacillus sp. Root239]|nr:hypothetical protein ASE46_19700 [Bacillus sp. Root239]
MNVLCLPIYSSLITQKINKKAIAWYKKRGWDKRIIVEGKSKRKFQVSRLFVLRLERCSYVSISFFVLIKNKWLKIYLFAEPNPIKLFRKRGKKT